MSWAKLPSLIAPILSGLIFSQASVREKGESITPSHPGRSRPEAAAGFPDYRQFRRNQFLSQIACGPMSLITILRSLGVSLTPDDIDRIIAAAGTKGTDLSQLQALAESYGLCAFGVEVSPEKLRQIGLYAVVHLNGTSFAAVTGYSRDGVQLVFPLNAPVVVSDDRFRRAFGEKGRALVVSTAPLSPKALGLAMPRQRTSQPRGPFLSLSKSVIAAGQIRSRDWEETITIRNDGTEPLQIKQVSSSCSCMAASVDRTLLQSAESAVLAVRGRQDQPGGFQHSVLITTNQPRVPPARVPVSGFLEPPVFFEKPSAALLKVIQGCERRIEVPLGIAEGGDVARVRVKAPDGVPLAAEIVTKPEGQLALAIRCVGHFHPGWYRYSIECISEEWPDSPPAVLRVVVEVIPRVDVFPASLLIADGELPTTWSRHLTLKFNEKRDVTEHDECITEWSNPAFAAAIRVDHEQFETGTLRINLSAAHADATEQLRGNFGDIKVRFSEGHDYMVRVYIGKDSFLSNGAIVQPAGN